MRCRCAGRGFISTPDGKTPCGCAAGRRWEESEEVDFDEEEPDLEEDLLPMDDEVDLDAIVDDDFDDDDFDDFDDDFDDDIDDDDSFLDDDDIDDDE